MPPGQRPGLPLKASQQLQLKRIVHSFVIVLSSSGGFSVLYKTNATFAVVSTMPTSTDIPAKLQPRWEWSGAYRWPNMAAQVARAAQ